MSCHKDVCVCVVCVIGKLVVQAVQAVIYGNTMCTRVGTPFKGTLPVAGVGVLNKVHVPAVK